MRLEGLLSQVRPDRSVMLALCWRLMLWCKSLVGALRAGNRSI